MSTCRFLQYVFINLLPCAVHSGHINGLWSLEKCLSSELGQIVGESLNLSQAQFILLSSMGDSPAFGE